MPSQTFLRLRDEKQEIIIRAAIGEFTENGFMRARVEDIAKRAGIAKGSIFQYFENKGELFNYCAAWGLEIIMKKLDGRMNIADMDIFDLFRDAEAVFATLQEEREISAFMMIAAGEPSLPAELTHAMYEVGYDYIRQLVQNGKKRGTIRRDIDEELIMEFFSAITNHFDRRWLHLYTGMVDGLDPESEKALNAEITQLHELLTSGLKGENYVKI
ncbi:MAG: TetR/AcrR family transcriptional regulator [Clostridiales bacterium]|jgi:AcrR family transcriptional regulator|nr:TetR/AcrR family transcriptional regulator [Clostridiales bacterium]